MSHKNLTKLEELPGFISDLPELIDGQQLELREHPGHSCEMIGIEGIANNTVYTLSESSQR